LSYAFYRRVVRIAKLYFKSRAIAHPGVRIVKVNPNVPFPRQMIYSAEKYAITH